MEKEQDRVLARLRQVLGPRDFYLAGGTAVALHLHHRVSRDLDLFSRSPRADLAAVRRRLAKSLRGVEVVSASSASLELRIGTVAVDIVRYPYAPLELPRSGPHDFPVAGLIDLAAMKLASIAGRGLRRDFWDLYEILRSGLTLENAAAAYQRRFGRDEADLYHVARSLTYFADAEADRVLPQGMTAQSWRRIRAYFVKAAPSLLDQAPPQRRRRPPAGKRTQGPR